MVKLPNLSYESLPLPTPQTLYSLVFTVAGGTLTADPNTGNVLPSTPTTTSVQVFLSRSTDKITEALPGADTFERQFSGRCVSPKVFPDSVLRQGATLTAAIVINGVSGTLEILPDPLNPYIGSQIGQRFKAKFKPRQ